MAILTSSETTYLPKGLKATGTDLDNLLLRSQSLAESPDGAGRQLENHSRVDLFDLQIPNRGIQIAPYTLQLKEWPIVGVPIVNVKWGWRADFETLGTDYYELNSNTGRLTVYSTCKEIEVTYQSGLDFSSPPYSKTVEDIKYLVGQLSLIVEQLDLTVSIDDARSQLKTYLKPFARYRTLI